MTHTALTADEEIRRIRGLATARTEYRMVAEGHVEAPARRHPAQDPACGAVITSTPRLTRVMRVQARLSTLIHRFGRRPANAIIGPAFTATDSSVTK